MYDGVQGGLAGTAELIREAEAPGHLQLGPLHQHSHRSVVPTTWSPPAGSTPPAFP